MVREYCSATSFATLPSRTALNSAWSMVCMPTAPLEAITESIW